MENGRIVDEEVTPEEQSQLTKRLTERAVSFIDRHHSQPFFFYLAHPMPHVPLHGSYETAPQNGVQKEVSSLSFPGLDREGG
jgi:arylsulfatase